MSKVKYLIDAPTDVSYQDEGPMIHYNLYAEGNTLEELIDNATIFEVYQDGDTKRHYGLDDISTNTLRTIAFSMIEKAIKETNESKN